MSDTPLDKFQGFDDPQENWSKLPHALIECLPLMTSEAEIKIVLYILRHTWGFKDDQKKITIDEFCSGRKRKDGSRFDSGVGLTANAVKAGIRNAIKHGFIEVSEDASDKARIKRYYHLRGSNSEGQTLTPKVRPSKSDPLESKFDPRSEKETSLKETSLKEEEEDNNSDSSFSPDSSFAEICQIWESNIGFLSPLISDKIKATRAEIPVAIQVEWFREAITRACSHNARSWSYVEKILNGWIAAGGIDLKEKKPAPAAKESPLPASPDPLPAPELLPEESVLQQAKRVLQQQMTRQTYDTLFRGATAGARTNGTYSLIAPSELARDWIQNRLHKTVTTIIKTIDPSIKSLEVVTL